MHENINPSAYTDYMMTYSFVFRNMKTSPLMWLMSSGGDCLQPARTLRSLKSGAAYKARAVSRAACTCRDLHPSPHASRFCSALQQSRLWLDSRTSQPFRWFLLRSLALTMRTPSLSFGTCSFTDNGVYYDRPII